MASNGKKVGIITFHASYNCGSMLQAFALQRFLEKNGYDAEMIDFSSKGQRRLYSIFAKHKNIIPKIPKKIVKYFLTFFSKKFTEK